MLAHAGSPKALDVHGFSFDPVDRCFAAATAASFVGFIAVVLWAWLSFSAPQGSALHHTHNGGATLQTLSVSPLSACKPDARLAGNQAPLCA